MLLTQYQAHYLAYKLLLDEPFYFSQTDGMAKSLARAKVELHPHQIEAALFAIQSPLSKGVILADEVGLGKTIEAGLVLCQKYAEGKRKLLVVCPASLRKQWAAEIEDKFCIKAIVLDGITYSNALKAGKNLLATPDTVFVVSYDFVVAKKNLIKSTTWNLVILDEAHKLKNLNTKTTQYVYEALADCPKLLLTATPLQNSLMDIYSLMNIADNSVFQTKEAFKMRYLGKDTDLDSLKKRLKNFVKRTLRKNVAYINYTRREALLVRFTPSEIEHELYERISRFILQKDSYAIPIRQRKLIVMIIRKILASSTQALIATLETVCRRLEALYANQAVEESFFSNFILQDESGIEEDYEDEMSDLGGDLDNLLSRNKLQAEIQEIRDMIQLAASIIIDSKTLSLISALEQGFDKMKQKNAPQKAVIFTESVRTQEYLYHFLEKDPKYRGRVLTFNGQNKEKRTLEIYRRWQENNPSTNNYNLEVRQAIIDSFKNDFDILIATEAAAEGLNLQFCSLVINYDLPWNPQRIEQRIGRCHRYGQKYDVIVINFLNERNFVEQRLYDILSEKCKLFDGVFGSSNEILGRVIEGVDFQNAIQDIYENCRTVEEIEFAFSKLQEEYIDDIKTKISEAQKQLFDNFDEEVARRFKMSTEEVIEKRDEVNDFFRILLQFLANDLDTELLLELDKGGPMEPKSKRAFYNITRLKLPNVALEFNYSSYPNKVSLVEQLKGRQCFMRLVEVTRGKENINKYVRLVGIDDEGNEIRPEILHKIFTLNARLIDGSISKYSQMQLETSIDRLIDIENDSITRYFFDLSQAESQKIQFCKQDHENELLQALKEIEEEINRLEKDRQAAINLKQKVEIGRLIADLRIKKQKEESKVRPALEELQNQQDILNQDFLNQEEDAKNISYEIIFDISFRIV